MTGKKKREDKAKVLVDMQVREEALLLACQNTK